MTRGFPYEQIERIDKQLLDKMVVNDKDNIDVYLNPLPLKWSYIVTKASKKVIDGKQMHIYDKDRTICDCLRYMGKMDKAKAYGINYQQCLQLFFQEEFLRRLSKSGYVEFLVLKGGLFIYTLTNFESRATIDVDLQAAIFKTLQNRGTPYEKNSFKRVVQLADDEDMQKKWKYFLKKMKDELLAFSVVIGEMQKFLEPVFDAVAAKTEWQHKWKSTNNMWLTNNKNYRKK